MRHRLTKLLTAFAMVAALAVGGAAIASATHPAPQKQQAKVIQKHAGKRTVAGIAPASEPAEAADSESAAETPDSTEAASTPESAADTAGQDAACKAAGVSPTADNVNYDDASGTCTLDNGNN
jgi:cytoskeletal protein RodZ